MVTRPKSKYSKYCLAASAALIAVATAPEGAQAIKDTPTSPGELATQAAALIGKVIDYDKQSKIADRSPHAKADA
jgi:hypothetical protein